MHRRAIVSGHKFKIGQLVSYLGRERAPGVYQITQLLPPEGEAFQYRIRVWVGPNRTVEPDYPRKDSGRKSGAQR
jgi:hypothetical protein